MLSFTRSVTRTATALAAGLVFPLAACSSESDPFDGIPAFPVDAPEVTVLNEGENPVRLAYRDQGNADGGEWSTTVAVSTGVDQHTEAPGTAVDPHAPAGGDLDTTTLPLSVTSGTAPAPGDGEQDAARQVDFTVGSGKHSDLAVGQDVAATEGFLMRWRTGEDGTVSTLKLSSPADAPERGRQAVEPTLLALVTNAVVFPQQPVGVGAVWTVASRVVGDATLQRTTTYTVTAIDGDSVSLDVSVAEQPSQRSLRIDAQAAGALDGSDVEVESAETTSQGSVVVDLAHPLPVSGQVAATTRLVYSGGDGKARVVQDTTRAVQYGV